MNATFVDHDELVGLAPLACARDAGGACVANEPLCVHMNRRLEAAGFAVRQDPGPCLQLFLQRNAWVSSRVLAALRDLDSPTLLLDADGQVLGWLGDAPVAPVAAAEFKADTASLSVRYSWELLRINEELVGGMQSGHILGCIDSGVHIEGHLVLGQGSRLLAGVFVEGNAVIGRDCRIGPNCHIRGNTSIGDGCRVGQAVEIKNSIVMDGACIGHLSYCGDSIVGRRVNFGAGTVTANYRHDEQPHRSMVGGVLVGTGRHKFGAVIGDDVHTGIHTSIYPGRKIWPRRTTRPGAIVQRDLTGDKTH